MNLVGTAASWVGRMLLLFVVIVAILVASHYFKESSKGLRDSIAAIPKLEEARTRMKDWVTAQVTETTDRVRNLTSAGAQHVQRRVEVIEGETRELKSQRRFPNGPIEFASAVIRGDLDEAIKVEVRAELLIQERAFLKQVLSIHEAASRSAIARGELERLLQVHINAWWALQNNASAQDRVVALHPIAHRIPWTPAYDKLDLLRAESRKLWNGNQRAYDEYMAYKRVVDLQAAPQRIAQFVVAQDSIQGLLAQLEGALTELKQMQNADWIARLHQIVSPFLSVALVVLVSIKLTPVAIKGLLYYLAAPAAGRRPPMCLLPAASGSIASAGTVSAVSRSIAIDSAGELLIRADYLQSSSRAGRKDTKWLLNAGYPLASIASGMFALTRVRSDSTESVVVSSTKDPLSEIAAIEIPVGSAVVLQPQHLVGVVQRLDQPVAVTSHWRLVSLHAWLTLQFRYLVFHGPAVLIVKGCRGVRAERPETGRNINQAATIGFTANLYYATTRCETFISYLSGQKALFNDSFSGSDGYYIYQETPRSETRSGVTGRGLEGIFDAFLKAFGI